MISGSRQACIHEYHRIEWASFCTFWPVVDCCPSRRPAVLRDYPMFVSIGLLISIYTIVRLIQIPFECSGACGVPFAGLHVRTRVWIVTGLSVLGVIGLCLVTSTLILEAIHGNDLLDSPRL